MNWQGESIPALWLAIQGSDGAVLSAMDYPLWPTRKISQKPCEKSVLLTKLLFGWILTAFFLCEFMDLNCICPQGGKTTNLVHHPAILTLWFISDPSLRDNSSSFFPFLALDLLLRQAQKSSGLLKGHQRTVQYLQHLGNVRRKQLMLHVTFIFDKM